MSESENSALPASAYTGSESLMREVQMGIDWGAAVGSQSVYVHLSAAPFTSPAQVQEAAGLLFSRVRIEDPEPDSNEWIRFTIDIGRPAAAPVFEKPDPLESFAKTPRGRKLRDRWLRYREIQRELRKDLAQELASWSLNDLARMRTFLIDTTQINTKFLITFGFVDDKKYIPVTTFSHPVQWCPVRKILQSPHSAEFFLREQEMSALGFWLCTLRHADNVLQVVSDCQLEQGRGYVIENFDGLRMTLNGENVPRTKAERARKLRAHFDA